MDTVKALNTISGQVATLPVRIVSHPVLGKHLVEVADDAKPYAPELYKSKSAEEFLEKPRRNRKIADESSEVTDEDSSSAVITTFDPVIVEDN